MSDVAIAVTILLLALFPLVGWRLECVLEVRPDATPPESPPPAHGHDRRV
jgi:hypothetical protein